MLQIARVTQITTHYYQCMQKSIFERKKRGTLKQMVYSSRRPDQLPLLSAKSRKLRLQLTGDRQKWTTEDGKNVAWSAESRFLLQNSDRNFRNLCKPHKNILCTSDSGCWRNGAGSIFLFPFLSAEHLLNVTAYPTVSDPYDFWMFPVG